MEIKTVLYIAFLVIQGARANVELVAQQQRCLPLNQCEPVSWLASHIDQQPEALRAHFRRQLQNLVCGLNNQGMVLVLCPNSGVVNEPGAGTQTSER